jgi:ribonucleotide reductase beta subunit family protein with ferritin-like domain
MKAILLVIENYAKKQTNKFIIYVLIVASVLFYIGFILGRSFAVLP